jgi:hypothetical protein
MLRSKLVKPDETVRLQQNRVVNEKRSIVTSSTSTEVRRRLCEFVREDARCVVPGEALLGVATAA